MLNAIWIGFFLTGIVVALGQLFLGDNGAALNAIADSTFEMSKLSAEIGFGLVGILSLWMGFFKIAETSGIIQKIGRLLEPLFTRLMPEVPKGHPALGSITMNMAANMLGLDNAATPMGLKAMADLQSLNPSPNTASNAQILFLVLNTSSVTLIPITIFMYRAQLGAANPADVFIPILLATLASTLAGLLAVAWVQKLPVFNRVVIGYLSILVAFVTGLIYWLSALNGEELANISRLIASAVLVGVIAVFLLVAFWRKLDAYSLFVEGAKEGFFTAIKLIPYLVAMLVAIGVLRASGALDLIIVGLKSVISGLGADTQFVDALPVAFMKPLSGSGARAMMIEVMNTYGVDSFLGRLASVMQGSTETTFYVLAVYFGSVGVSRIRHALWCGLLADAVGIITAVFVSYWFFT